MSFDLKDYVDVPARIAGFKAAYPEGSLQSELERLDGGWLCKAWAYRTPDDVRPGIGHAFEPVPGKTPYTKDSEAMNAETSAWGRAIVALGFETKHIASSNDVRARSGADGDAPSPQGAAPVTAEPSPDTSDSGAGAAEPATATARVSAPGGPDDSPAAPEQFPIPDAAKPEAPGADRDKKRAYALFMSLKEKDDFEAIKKHLSDNWGGDNVYKMSAENLAAASDWMQVRLQGLLAPVGGGASDDDIPFEAA